MRKGRSGLRGTLAPSAGIRPCCAPALPSGPLAAFGAWPCGAKGLVLKVAPACRFGAVPYRFRIVLIQLALTSSILGIQKPPVLVDCTIVRPPGHLIEPSKLECLKFPFFPGIFWVVQLLPLDRPQLHGGQAGGHHWAADQGMEMPDRSKADPAVD